MLAVGFVLKMLGRPLPQQVESARMKVALRLKPPEGARLPRRLKAWWAL